MAVRKRPSSTVRREVVVRGQTRRIRLDPVQYREGSGDSARVLRPFKRMQAHDRL
jgi:hypothetical protein